MRRRAYQRAMKRYIQALGDQPKPRFGRKISMTEAMVMNSLVCECVILGEGGSLRKIVEEGRSGCENLREEVAGYGGELLWRRKGFVFFVCAF